MVESGKPLMSLVVAVSEAGDTGSNVRLRHKSWSEVQVEVGRRELPWALATTLDI